MNARVEFIGEASTGREALDLARRLRPDALIMDTCFPDLGGLDLLAVLRRERNPVAVFFFSGLGDSKRALEAFLAGAEGYFLKQESSTALQDAVLRLAEANRRPWPRWSANAEPATGPRAASDPAPARGGGGFLSHRETQVLQCLAAGLRTREIAAGLQLTEATVRTHVKNILRKTGTRGRTQVVLWAIRCGLVSPHASYH